MTCARTHSLTPRTHSVSKCDSPCVYGRLADSQKSLQSHCATSNKPPRFNYHRWLKTKKKKQTKPTPWHDVLTTLPFLACSYLQTIPVYTPTHTVSYTSFTIDGHIFTSRTVTCGFSHRSPRSPCDITDLCECVCVSVTEGGQQSEWVGDWFCLTLRGA